MSHLDEVLAADLTPGDLIDLTPLIDRAASPLTTEDRHAAADGYATITALSEHGGFVDIGTDIFDLQVRSTDQVGRLVDN